IERKFCEDGFPSVLLTLLKLRPFLLALFVAAASSAQHRRAWIWQNPLPQGGSIYAIRFASDGRHGWAVGADGLILRTASGGFDWEWQESPARTALYGLFIKDEKRAVAVGARGTILLTDDGGAHWKL